MKIEKKKKNTSNHSNKPRQYPKQTNKGEQKSNKTTI